MKIYNEIILKWNDATNQHDTVYEDSYDHVGDIYHLKDGEGIDPKAFKKQKKTIEGTRDLLEEISKDISRAQDGTKDWTRAQVKLNQNLSTMVSSMDKAETLSGFIVTQVTGIRDGTLDVQDLTQNLNKELETQISRQQDVTDSKKQQVDLVKDLAAAESELAKAKAGYSNLTESQAQHAVDMSNQILKSRRDITSELENEAVQGGINVGTAEGLLATQKTMNAAKKRSTALSSLDEKLLGGMFGEMFNLVKSAGTLLGILAIAGTIFAGISAMTDEIGESFGAVAFQSDSFSKSFGDAKSTALMLGISVDEMVSGVGKLATGLGIGNEEALNLSNAMMDTAKATGMTTDEVSGLFSSLVNITGQSAETANNFIKQASMLAKASNVAPGQVLADMADSSEQIASFTKGTGENMVQAAVKAAQLGLSLSDVASVAESLLDFETSIGSEMEAAVILGRDLNLQRARELALAGEMSALQDELVSQVGSQAEFEAMNVIERKALADAIGLSVSQVARLTTEAGKSSEELMSMREFSAEDLVGKDALGNLTLLTNRIKMIGNTILVEIGNRLKDIDIQSLVAQAEKIGATIGKVLLKTVEWGKVIAIVIASMATFKLVHMIAGFVKLVGLSATWLANLVMGNSIKVFSDAPSIVGATKSASGFISLAGGLKAMGTMGVLKGIGAVALLGAAIGVAAYAFSFLAGVNASSIIAFSASLIVLGAAVFGLGTIMFTGVGALVFGAGILALAGLGGAILLMGLGMSQAAPHIGVFTTFLTGLGPLLEDVSNYTDPINELSTSLTGLATSMTLLGLSGILALPVLRGLEKVGLIGTNKTTAPVTEKKTTGKESSVSDLINAFTDGTIPKLIATAVVAQMPNVHKVKLETSRAG